MTKKISAILISFVFTFTALSVLSCPCAHASTETITVEQSMPNHCGHHATASNKKSAHSKNGDCCGKCKTESVFSSGPSFADVSLSSMAVSNAKNETLLFQNIAISDVLQLQTNSLQRTWYFNESPGVIARQPLYIVFETLLF